MYTFKYIKQWSQTQMVDLRQCKTVSPEEGRVSKVTPHTVPTHCLRGFPGSSREKWNPALSP